MRETEFIVTHAGVKMPKIIYGTAWKKERTADLVVQAVQLGFRGIDTACQPKHYAEEEVGKALGRLNAQGINRENLYIQTKFTPISGQDPNNIPYDIHAPLHLQVAQSFEHSQQNLQSDYVDALVLHSPLFPFSALMKVYDAMQAIHKNSGARQLGISNCYDLQMLKRLYDESEVKPAVLQNRFYADSGYDIELRRYCNEKGIIYQSFWSLTANPHLLMSRPLIMLAKKYAKTPEQIFFRFLTQIGITPLSGTTSKEHMQEDLNIFDIELKTSELSEINSLLA